MDNHNSNHDSMIDISELVKNVKNRLNNQNIKNSNDTINRLGSEKYNNDKTMGKNTENKGNSSKTIGKYMVKKEELKNNKNNNNSNNNANGKNNKHEVIAKIEYLSKNNDNNNYNENNNNNINNKYDKDNYYNNEHNNFESQLNLNNPNYYINRELSWLEFNKRVLEESSDESNPLLERLKFLAIFNSNLDEFFMIRVAGLKQRVSANILEKSPDGLTPYEQLVEIHKKTKKLLKYSELQYNILIDQLRNHGIYIHKFSEIDHDLKHQAKEYFKKYILPVLTPLGIDATHPFPHVVNLGFNILIEINSEEGIKLGLVPIPKNIPRFIEIYNNNKNGKNSERHFILLEELIMEHINKLFPHQDIKRMITFRLTRDADIRIQEDEADDLLEEIEKGLKERRFGKAVRLEIYENSGKGGNKYLQEFLKDEYDLEDMDIYKMKIPLNLTDLWQLYECIDDINLKYKPYIPYLSSIFDIDIFSTLKSKDLVLFLPYDSFEPIIDFLNDAAENPDVLAIKIVLYRTGRHSPIIDALKKAVRNGKEVTAIIELKARFDEESNISWAKCLEEEGVHVVYGIPKLKIHAKMIMVVKKEDGGIKRYVHLGTGNYNHTTAKVYSDLGIMSSDEILGKDVEKIFNAITGYFQHPKLNKIYIPS